MVVFLALDTFAEHHYPNFSLLHLFNTVLEPYIATFAHFPTETPPTLQQPSHTHAPKFCVPHLVFAALRLRHGCGVPAPGSRSSLPPHLCCFFPQVPRWFVVWRLFGSPFCVAESPSKYTKNDGRISKITIENAKQRILS